MADAVLEVALENISFLVKKELRLFLGFHQDLKRLESLLTTIKATLEDAEEKQLTNRAIENWLQKLKDAAYELDDILDECATKVLELENQGGKHGLSNKVQSSRLSSFHPKHVAFRVKMAKKMKKIKEKLDEIAEERTKYHLTEMVPEGRTGVIDWRQTTSVITQPQVYGREEDKDKIVEFLVGDAAFSEDLSICPIVGLGGLGKTTLAQLVFNHERVVSHFELRIWVCVSEDFSLKRITKAIIVAASGSACEDLDLEPLQRRLQDLLQRKRYLLVLDDVWDHEQENWQRLKSVLSWGANGSSILVTTRLPKVAAIMGTMPTHELSMLSDNDCWELFKQRAFGSNEVERAELLVIGREIVKKCGGVPLAAKALGGLLRFKREEKEWLYVKESNLWSLSHDENSIMPALRLSYLNLPVKLRQCFAYCAIFPKDETISKQYLIELWMANGFISSNGILDVEDIGDEVWNELYWRSFFQDIETDRFGKVTSFKMHDLVCDLAQSVTEEVCCITEDNSITTLSERIRHLSIYGWKSFEEVNSIQLHQVKSLKTYIMPNYYYTGQLSAHVFKCYSLRVLESKGLYSLSSSIGRLKFLRYLNISYGQFRTLPLSLCGLVNLHSLKLDYCQHLQELPNNLICLKALQCLSLSHCNKLSSLPPQIGMMTSLKTLSMYFIGKKEGLLLKELGQLNLKGELYIKHLERSKSVKDAQEANMLHKYLNKLLLSWDKNEDLELQENVEQILEVLQPYTQQLQILGVKGYKGACFPHWMSSPSLKNLNYLVLLDCKNCLQLPQLGKLPSLRNLIISNMIHITYLYEESYDGGEVFMALEFLLLEKLPNLTRLLKEDGENMFPCLSKLQIIECPKMLALPSLPSINDLRVQGKCNQDLLSSINKFLSLESLHFRSIGELTWFPDGMLPDLASLKVLCIHTHSKLEVLLTETIDFNVIQELYIQNCDNLKSLGDEVLLQGLHSLKILEIVQCHKFNLSASFQYLTCLEVLVIGQCRDVKGLDEALQHMSALRLLKLWDLPNLESLPDCLGNLGLLSILIISKCPKLTCLPMSIHCLNSLKILEIYCCPELKKQCQKEKGEYWPKIAHIPHIILENLPVFFGSRNGVFYASDTGLFWILSLSTDNVILDFWEGA